LKSFFSSSHQSNTTSSRLQIQLQSPPLPQVPLNQSTNHIPLNMPLMRRTKRTTAVPRTTRATRSTARPSLKTRLLGGRKTRATRAPATTTTTTTTRTTRTTHGAHGHATAAPVHHHKRHATMGDKVSGALMKLRGSLTRRPGLKVSRRWFM
jgi:hypothetical protein